MILYPLMVLRTRMILDTPMVQGTRMVLNTPMVQPAVIILHTPKITAVFATAGVQVTPRVLQPADIVAAVGEIMAQLANVIAAFGILAVQRLLVVADFSVVVSEFGTFCAAPTASPLLSKARNWRKS